MPCKTIRNGKVYEYDCVSLCMNRDVHTRLKTLAKQEKMMFKEILTKLMDNYQK